MTLLKHHLFETDFLQKNMMGPNAVLLLEELLGNMLLRKGMRILDLGPGTGLTSIYLAKMYDAEVFAVDLWISASENYARIKEFGLEEQIIPLNLDVHTLPFPENYFDAMISIDSYQYYGAKEGFLEQHIAPYIKEDGLLGVVIPGLQHDFENDVVPEVLRPFWVENIHFYSHDFWRRLWQKSEAISLESCQEMKSFRQAWDEWLACDNAYAISDHEMMKAEQGNYFDFVQLIARKR